MTDDSEYVVRPPWSKSHTVTLALPDAYRNASANSANESNYISRHHPLASTDWDGGRKAGTYGSEEGGAYIDNTEDLEGRKRVWKETMKKIESMGDLMKVLKDGDRVVSVRDVKKVVPNFRLLDPKHHAFARFVLPVTESDIKNQDWLGKPHPEEEKMDDSKKENADTRERKRDLSKDTGRTKENHEPSVDQKRMIEKILAEMRTLQELKNNDVRPQDELKLLDDDALEQLESHLSADDQTTPDSWIPRSSRLLRLTGKHPLNAEPDLSELFAAGMITPTMLHYVRSHGAVPQLDWDSHSLSVFSDPPGLIASPREWTMDEIANGDFAVSELPVTMACDGNRRKEVNMVKRSGGFNWSAAGVSTCVWRGIQVRDLLRASGLQEQPATERWYLNYEGADEPSEGRYATSIPLNHALDPANDVMLAFGQNGRVLHPDHGYPLRSLIPGYVGGRQVKWLKKLWVTKVPNTSHYHIWDNKVVPSEIDSKIHPLASAFFHHEDFACNEQTLQSIICKPAHDEQISLSSGANGLVQMYTIEGFAYNGAGSPVQRVELTLDGGKTWRYCVRRFLDRALRHGGKQWAWLFWSCDVKVVEFTSAEEIAVRAFDSRKIPQPEHITWNLLGMMNNAWYRVRPSIGMDSATGNPVIHFRHPVAPGQAEGGWMTPNKEDALALQSSDGKEDREFSIEEIAKHNKKNDAWIILEGRVYDVTSVIPWHPGEENAILRYAGKATVDSTNEYKGIHDNYANSKRDECLVGILSPEGIEAMNKDAERAAKVLEKTKNERAGLALQPDAFTLAKLVKRRALNEDTRVYTFELPKKQNGEHGVLGLPVGKHVQIAVHFKDQAVLRSYTPIRPVLSTEEDGTFDLLVKTYLPDDDSPFPPGGTVSNYLDTMVEGELIDIRGPNGEIVYKGHGEFEIEGKNHIFDKINLVAGGSGLTPHWQLIHAVLSDKTDKTLISLIYSNTTYDDILMREELRKYADESPDRFKLWHTLSKAPKDKALDFTEGHLDKKVIEAHFYPAKNRTAAFLCGPPGLIAKAALPALKELGFEEGENIFGF